VCDIRFPNIFARLFGCPFIFPLLVIVVIVARLSCPVIKKGTGKAASRGGGKVKHLGGHMTDCLNGTHVGYYPC